MFMCMHVMEPPLAFAHECMCHRGAACATRLTSAFDSDSSHMRTFLVLLAVVGPTCAAPIIKHHSKQLDAKEDTAKITDASAEADQVMRRARTPRHPEL